MGLHKRHGNPNWWHGDSDAEAKVQRRSSGTIWRYSTGGRPSAPIRLAPDSGFDARDFAM